MKNKVKITALAGGVGGAKLAVGLQDFLGDDELSIIVNTADDFEHFGLRISPDIDTVCYTLAGLANAKTGWGRKDETWEVYKTLKELDAPHWFKLGDHDLGLHMERTRLLQDGKTLTEITRIICSRLGIRVPVLPMSDQPVRTTVKTVSGKTMGFQEYFVKEQCEPQVAGFSFIGSENAEPTESVMRAIRQSDLVVICPSNPWVSIDPILGIRGVRESLREKHVVAVSPIIGGKTIKGPAAKMYSELGITPCAKAVANHYRDLLSGFVLDTLDEAEANDISAWGIMPLVTETIMRSQEDRIELAKKTVEFGISLPPKG